MHVEDFFSCYSTIDIKIWERWDNNKGNENFFPGWSIAPENEIEDKNIIKRYTWTYKFNFESKKPIIEKFTKVSNKSICIKGQHHK